MEVSRAIDVVVAAELVGCEVGFMIDGVDEGWLAMEEMLVVGEILGAIVVEVVGGVVVVVGGVVVGVVVVSTAGGDVVTGVVVTDGMRDGVVTSGTEADTVVRTWLVSTCRLTRKAAAEAIMSNECAA